MLVCECPVLTPVNRPFSIYIEIHTWLRGLGNKIKEIILRLSNEEYISFVLFPQASEPSMNFNIWELVY